MAKIYTTNKANNYWLYSGLEGFFCFILDFKEKRKFFVLYDLNNFEVLFKFELFCKFEPFYKPLSNKFHCFETDKGFIGINFVSNAEADSFEKCVRKYDDNLTDQFIKKNINRRKDKYKKGKEYLAILKNKFCDIFENKISQQKNSAHENRDNNNLVKIEKIKIFNFEDFDKSINDTEIFKPRFDKILLKITYDKEKKLFNLQNIPTNLKNLFKKSGIKNSDFKNQSLALNIFKFFLKIFDELQNYKKNKTQNLEKIGHKKLSIIKDDPNDLINSLKKISE
jgi:dsDNA-binding SOS-regulon protein